MSTSPGLSASGVSLVTAHRAPAAMHLLGFGPAPVRTKDPQPRRYLRSHLV
jgi:hypothetical protein